MLDCLWAAGAPKTRGTTQIRGLGGGNHTPPLNKGCPLMPVWRFIATSHLWDWGYESHPQLYVWSGPQGDGWVLKWLRRISY